MNKKWIKLGGLALAAGSLITTAEAVPTLTADGVTEAVDNGVGDSNPLIGQVFWSGLINGWEVSEDFGIASPPDVAHGGTAPAPVLDVTFNVIYLGGGNPTLTLAFTADGLGPFSTGGFHSLGGTSLGGTLTSSAMSVTGAILVNGVAVAPLTIGPLSSLAFSGTASGTPVGGTNSTVTIQTTITATQAGQFASGDENFSVTPPTTRRIVPDGGTTLALFGAGLSGFALLRRKLGV